MRKLLLAAGLLGLTSAMVSAAPALQAVNQHPYSVHIFPNAGMFVFYAKITSGTLPGCSGDHRWSISTDKPGAQELISMVIAAKTSRRTITVMGDGSCNPDGYGYQVSYMYYN